MLLSVAAHKGDVEGNDVFEQNILKGYFLKSSKNKL